MIVDSAIYSDGRRTGPCPLEETLEACRERKGFAWIDLHEPPEEEFEALARDFGLHDLAIEDVIEAHQRSKLEHYGDYLFLVLKPALYLEKLETVEFSELHLLMGRNFVLTVRHGRAPSLHTVRQRLEGEPDLLRRGPAAVLHGVLDGIVDGYEPVVEGLGNDIEEIEADVFGETPDPSRRIYELSREILAFRRAVHPLAGMLEHLTEENPFDLDAEMVRRLRDVHDHALRTAEQIDGFRELLSNILNVNLTLVSVQQTDQTKKISAWAAILIVPTIITGVYGMNFRYMPELGWPLGYPLALSLMLGISTLLYLGFKRSGWL